ncbi:MAG: hypothetical protein QQN41_11040 [Nitrosopumilus sp.]
MYKLTVKLSNHPSPLEHEVIPNGLKEDCIFVEDIHDTNNVLDKVETLVEAIENRNKAIIRIQVLDENGNTILNGNVQNGSFSGVKIS